MGCSGATHERVGAIHAQGVHAVGYLSQMQYGIGGVGADCGRLIPAFPHSRSTVLQRALCAVKGATYCAGKWMTIWKV